jgi:hypothetical protein
MCEERLYQAFEALLQDGHPFLQKCRAIFSSSKKFFNHGSKKSNTLRNSIVIQMWQGGHPPSTLKIKSIPLRAPSAMLRSTGIFMILLVRDASRMAV